MAKPSKGLPLTPLSPDNTPIGRLPPFEVAKAYAFDVVIGQMEKHLGKSASLFLGQEKGEFISNHLKLKAAPNLRGKLCTRTIENAKRKGGILAKSSATAWVAPQTSHSIRSKRLQTH